ncbi:FAD/NAD(P)-binding protein [Ensifer sp. NM-2]|uniref:FAD/NAD(P)-binding protein n=1 Tax=Ensifer sp. NM-2 TaxID=2109730 RepID=UPI001304E8CF|nr:FAD/NAD(P)-binding protein [Ensifer sp. NM-2]
MAKFEFFSAPERQSPKSVAVVGDGPSALYFLKHIVQHCSSDLQLTFFGQSGRMGGGLCYDASFVGRESLANVACQEIPDLHIPAHEWFLRQPESWLLEHGIDRQEIGPTYVPTRDVLGQYFDGQFRSLLFSAVKAGISITCQRQTVVKDLVPLGGGVNVVYRSADADADETLYFDYVVVASGCSDPGRDNPATNVLPSPWPVSRLEGKSARNIGVMGSSLAAVDACLALARKNGTFQRDCEGRLTYAPHPVAEDLKIVIYAPRCLLPLVRHRSEFQRFSRHSYISDAEIRMHMKDNGGHLSVDYLFEYVLKPVLKVKAPELHAEIEFLGLEAFVASIEDRWHRDDPFALLRKEYLGSVATIRDDGARRWIEVVANIAYTLNFHMRDLVSSEMMRVRQSLTPLVTHLLAMLPLRSCEQLLAVHESGCLTLENAGADIEAKDVKQKNKASVAFRGPQGDDKKKRIHDLIVDCRGHEAMDLGAFPFRTLVGTGVVRPARLTTGATDTEDRRVELGGIDVDSGLHPMSNDGKSSQVISILAAPAIHGLYPHSPGLSLCNELARIVAGDLQRNVLPQKRQLTPVGISWKGALYGHPGSDNDTGAAPNGNG